MSSSKRDDSSHLIEGLSSGEEDALACIECETCGVEFSSPKAYDQHLKGKKHHKMLNKMKIMSKVTDAEDDDSNGEDVKEEIQCEVCRKSFSGHVPYYAHLKSQVHAKNVNKKKIKDQLTNDAGVLNGEGNENLSDSDDEILPSLFARCEVCKKVFSGPENYNQHLKSSDHKKKIKQKGIAEGLNLKDDDDKNTLACETCNKSFSGVVPFTIHMKSAVHQKEIARAELISKLKEFCKETDDKTVFVCKECEKKFSDPFAFKVHLSSKDHEKQESMKEIKNFLSLHKEIMWVKAIENNESDEDDDKFFVCKICNVSLSGPENAKSHVISKKHISTQKQLKVLKKIKRQEIVKSNGEKEKEGIVPTPKGVPSINGSSNRIISNDVENNLIANNEDFELI